ncbi:C69 family dipeptidase [Bifidobacterium thermophilum]|uniref:Dipeptidase n=1 Tax=Bifidobacterium thermophilum TaxID=33905 RepID=A0A7X9NRM7_9BIFI|nr:C69 family dipeptidase [Bifidobacterium thermophilum]NME62560.1 C69 family dipeptidase [Bifidobacterium thermophilum]
MSCTTLLVGKSATIDGSTMIARNDDSGSGRYDPKRFIAVNPADQPRHYRSELSHVSIELPDDPCRYSIVPNALPGRGILAECGISERNIAMSATETIAVNERVLGADPMVELQAAQGEPGDDDYRPEVPGGIGEEDFITLVLPYVRSAREGVRRLGELLERFGTYEANGIAISDVDEIWYVETIGGHHWIARRVPDDCYAAIPNQLGLDGFDLEDAFGDARNHMCSADLVEFIRDNHLDRGMGSGGSGVWRAGTFNPRTLFGTRTTKDHIYNTPRAWYMERYLNPSEDWDSPAARYTPISDDIPWCRRPENRVTVEDVAFLMASHFEDTPYDPYGSRGTDETRRRYRPIGINRTGQMGLLQIRPYEPETNRSVMWLQYGSGPFTTLTPFYTNVRDTPAYLRDTGAEVSTDSFYWTSRIIAALADPHYVSNSNAIEHYRENVMSRGHAHIACVDAALRGAAGVGVGVGAGAGAGHAVSCADIEDVEGIKHSGVRMDETGGAVSDVESPANPADSAGSADADATCDALEQANQRMADYLRAQTQELLGKVLYTSSNLMRNAFAMSDR